MTIGSFINARLGDNNTDVIRNPLLMHEYGHYIQSQTVGPLYVGVMSLSGLSALSNKTVNGTLPLLYQHDIRWYEQWANRNAANYFARHYRIDWSQYDYPNNTYPRHFRR